MRRFLRSMPVSPLYIEPEFGVTYILFLKKDLYANKHYGAIEPFSIHFRPDNAASLKSNLIRNTSDFIEDIIVDGSRAIRVTYSASGLSIDDEISGSPFEDMVKEILMCLGSE